jgi:hypothetical protein
LAGLPEVRNLMGSFKPLRKQWFYSWFHWQK